MKKAIISSSALMLALGAQSIFAGVIFKDTTGFSSWYQATNANNTLTKGSDTLGYSVTTNASLIQSSYLIGRSFTATTLAVGDTITAKYDVNFSGTVYSGASMRIGLYDTANGISANNFAGGAPGSFNGYFSYVLDNNAISNVIRGASNGTWNNNTLPTIGVTGIETIGYNTSKYDFGTGTNYTLQLELTRTASGLDATTKLYNGANLLYTITGSDTTTPYTSFDSMFISFGNNSKSSADMTIDNISVTVIPEPATVGMLGLGALVTLLFRRMRA